MPTWEIVRNGKVIGEMDKDTPPTRRDVQRAMTAIDRQSVLPQTPSAGELEKPQGISEEEWAALSPADKAKNVLRWTGRVMGGAGYMMGGTADDAMDHPAITLATAALPLAVKAVKGALPSTVRAGAKFQQVMGAAKDVPVDVAKPGAASLRVMELSERGGSMPKAIRDFLKRVTDPSKAELTYGEARDFYSNLSRLSADETRRLTPVMRREVGQVRALLNEALSGSAESVGQGATYRSAMKEYARAAKLRDVSQRVAKWALPAGATGAAGYYAVEKLSGR